MGFSGELAGIMAERLDIRTVIFLPSFRATP
jgi:hypothetical protein